MCNKLNKTEFYHTQAIGQVATCTLSRSSLSHVRIPTAFLKNIVCKHSTRPSPSPISCLQMGSRNHRHTRITLPLYENILCSHHSNYKNVQAHRLKWASLNSHAASHVTERGACDIRNSGTSNDIGNVIGKCKLQLVDVFERSWLLLSSSAYFLLPWLPLSIQPIFSLHGHLSTIKLTSSFNGLPFPSIPPIL